MTPQSTLFWPIDLSEGPFAQSQLIRLRISGDTQPVFTLNISRVVVNARNYRLAVPAP